MNRNGRKSNGQFSAGNPGRPARDVEVEYLATLSEAVTPDRLIQSPLTGATVARPR